MDAAGPLSRFRDFNLDPALAEAAETLPGEQVIEGILRLDDASQVPAQFIVVSQFNRICTGRFLARDILDIRRHPNVISFKAARSLGVFSPPPANESFGGIPRNAPSPFGGRGCIVAALDFGLDFAHPNFVNGDGTTRLITFWNQGALYDAAYPNAYGYGRIFSREEINAALRSADPYATLGYHPAISDTGLGSHGTHTLDIAAGNGQVGMPGAGCFADLIFIHLSTPRLGTIGDLGDSVRMLEALDYVDRIAAGRPWVVNLSVGRTAGSHDGTSPVEQGMHELLRRGPGRAIVQSAGNYRSANMAVEGALGDGEHRDLQWLIDPADTTDNEMDIWYSGKDRFVIAIRPPQTEEFLEVKLGDAANIVDDSGLGVGRIYHRRDDPNNRDNHCEIFLYPGAPAGTWTVRLIGDYAINGRFHAWIERDLAKPGAQSRFDPAITSQAYTLGTIATSPLVITVGAYDANLEDNPLAPFSSCGPTRDERRNKPELLAPGVGVVAARSIPRGESHQQGLLVPRSGTSMAAPHVTGAVAALFEAAGRPVSIFEIRDCLKHSAQPVSDPRLGDCWGRLDIAAAIRAITGQQAWAPVFDAAADTEEAEIAEQHSVESDFETALPATMNFPVETFVIESDEYADEGVIMNSNATEDYLERADQAVRNSTARRNESECSFLQQLLSGLSVEFPQGQMSPAELFRAIVRRGSWMPQARNVLEVVGLPAQAPRDSVRAGDWIVRSSSGTGDIGHLAVVASDNLLPAWRLASDGVAAESMQPGSYGLVIEAGAFPHSRTSPFARRLLDSRGRLNPRHVVAAAESERVECRPRPVSRCASRSIGPGNRRQPRRIDLRRRCFIRDERPAMSLPRRIPINPFRWHRARLFTGRFALHRRLERHSSRSNHRWLQCSQGCARTGSRRPGRYPTVRCAARCPTRRHCAQCSRTVGVDGS
jgi:subtilisin family serine protease